MVSLIGIVALEPVYWELMMTSSNGNIFRVTGPLCGEFTDPGEFPTQRPVTQSFDVFFDMRPNKRLSKQSWGWWFEKLSLSLWRHRNVVANIVTLHHVGGSFCVFAALLRPSVDYFSIFDGYRFKHKIGLGVYQSPLFQVWHPNGSITEIARRCSAPNHDVVMIYTETCL